MRQLTWILAISFTAVLTAAPIEKKDVEYGRPEGHPLLLDLYVPDGPGPFPAAILVHGGGFDGGSKSTNVKPLFDVLAGALQYEEHRRAPGQRRQ
jgi:acetyl esterase